MIKIAQKTEQTLEHKTECLILACVEEKKPAGTLKKLNDTLAGAIGNAFENKRFSGKPEQTLLLNSPGKASNLLLVGIGKSKDVTAEKVCRAAATAAKLAEQSKFKSISADLGVFETVAKGKGGFYGELASAVAEGAGLALYRFENYKSKNDKDDPPSRVEKLTLLTPSKSRQAATEKAIVRAEKIVDAVHTARDLISHPGNTVTPTYLAEHAKKIARKNKLTCKVLGKKEMEKLGMGSLLGVAQGSDQPPALIVLEYKGAAKNKAPTAIVGKGITFDTGGISLKPGNSMDEMKMDMSGAATTLATLQLVSSMKLKANVVGIVAAAENMPGGGAIKPGDILKSMSGKTIEVLNTDAEGRLVLADALTYAQRFKPKEVIDLATLTGAVLHALGHHAAAVVGTNPAMIEKLKDAGDATGERVWELPLWEEFEKGTKSEIADLKNIASPGFGAGTIMGAAFLKAFAGEQPWTHIDIAGTAWGFDRPYTNKGPSGYGVRLLLRYLEKGR
ncbi:MAG: leucyl aminopeptidase [Nitrospinae bacterium]|nr:leucyl aminopeptidase [Nitrospinota bacterium]MZH14380.1 leucyl aminopeptidase [Nitrospinota bacterium]